MTAQYQIEGSTAADIRASVERAVRTGALPAGATLPPVRGLASALGVSPATVAKAYQELRGRGVVETAGRNGTRVRGRPAVQARLSRHVPVPPGALDLSAGEPLTRLLPDYGRQLARLAGAAAAPGTYRDGGPLPELIDLARARLAADGVPVTGAALTVTGGALDGIERLLTTQLRPGDRVAVEDPGWGNLLDLVAALGLTPVGMPVDDQGPTETGLRRVLAAGVGAVIITSRAQNPTGAAVDGPRCAALRGLLSAYPNVLLIEDDHAAELSSVPLHPLVGAGPCWAFLRSVSKPYGPDLRLAVLAGDEATVARVAGRMRMGAGWVSTLLQRLVILLWQDPEVAGLVARARQEYAARRAALAAALAARGMTVLGRTGLNLWVPVPDETRAVAVLRDQGYAVAPGARFRIASPPAIRITVGPVEPAAVEPLADAVAAAVRVDLTGAARST